MTPFRLLFRWIALTFAAVCLVLVGVLGVARKNDGWKIVISGIPLGYRQTDYSSDLYWFDSNIVQLVNLTSSQNDAEFFPAFSSNGNWLGYVQSSTDGYLICVRYQMGEAACFEPPIGQVDFSLQPTWLPNTNHFVFAASTVLDVQRYLILYLLDADTGAVKELVRTRQSYRFMTLLNSGHLASHYWQGEHSVVETSDLLEVTDREIAIMHPIFDIAWSPDASKFATSNFDNGFLELYIFNVSTGTEQLIYRRNSPPNTRTVGLTWSPDGTRLAFKCNELSYSGQVSRIFVIDQTGNLLFRSNEYLSHEYSDVFWSPDSLQVAYTEIVNSEGMQSYTTLLDITTGQSWRIGQDILTSNSNDPPAWYPQ